MLYRRPLHEVAQWPAADIRLIQHYLYKQPAPEERINIALAMLRRTFAMHWSPRGSPAPDVMDFLPYHDPWPTEPTPAMVADEARYSDVDRSFLANL